MVTTGSWRLTAGFATGVLALLAASAAVGGIASVPNWIAFAPTAESGEASRCVGLPALVAVVTGSQASASVAAGVLGAASIALSIRLRDLIRAHPESLIPIGVVLSLVCSPHVYPDDFLVLAPAILLVVRRDLPAALTTAAGLSVMTVAAEFLYPAIARAIPVCLLLLLFVLIRDLRGLRPALPPAAPAAKPPSLAAARPPA